MNAMEVSEADLIQDSGLLDPNVFVPAVERVDSGNTSLEAVYLDEHRNWWCETAALFDGGYYLSQYEDVLKSGMNPLVHYIRHGYLEGRNPSPMVDIGYILQQIVQKAGPLDDSTLEPHAILSQYGGLRELLVQTDCDPSPFFSNEHYRRVNEGLVPEWDIPLEDYVRRRGRAPGSNKFLECTPVASFDYYMRQHPDLAAAGVIPLRHLLVYGLNERRKFHSVEVVSNDFLRNTAILFGDERMSTLPGMLESKDGRTHLPGPFWPTPFAKMSIPALAHVADAGHRSAFVGVVLFKNSSEEVRRLHESIEQEIRSSEGCDIEFKYIANDGEIDRYRTLVGDRVVSSPNRENIGFGRAHNLLMEECFEHDRLYIGANPDGYFVPGCIKALLNFNDYFDGQALIEAPSMPIDHPKWHDPITLDTQWVSGACFAISRRIWGKVKGFDEKIHLYCEDVDLSWRARLSGAKLKVCPTARFMHDVTPRFYRKDSDSVVFERQKSMLKGAYYLARKWGAKDKADLYLGRLAKDLDPRELADIVEPDIELDPAAVENIADFSHDRFAPSRFWK